MFSPRLVLPPPSLRSMSMLNLGREGTLAGSGPINRGPGPTEGTGEAFDAARPTFCDEIKDE